VSESGSFWQLIVGGVGVISGVIIESRTLRECNTPASLRLHSVSLVVVCRYGDVLVLSADCLVGARTGLAEPRRDDTDKKVRWYGKIESLSGGPNRRLLRAVVVCTPVLAQLKRPIHSDRPLVWLRAGLFVRPIPENVPRLANVAPKPIAVTMGVHGF
jgi:hypothetical protein